MFNSAIFLLALSTVTASQAIETDTASHEEVPHAVVAVDYADTLQGVSAMLAVQACVPHAARPFTSTASVALGSSGAALRHIEEHQVQTEHDVIVRVIDRDGREISRHEGAKDVCGYARLAAAFLAQDRAAAERSTR